VDNKHSEYKVKLDIERRNLLRSYIKVPIVDTSTSLETSSLRTVRGDPVQAASDKSTHWEVTPPSVRQGRRVCLPLDYTVTQEWSRETVGHVVAVDFCYFMLREEHLRKQASEARQSFAQNKVNYVLGVVPDEGKEIAHPTVNKRSSSTSAL
jgi:hypothetical protein